MIGSILIVDDDAETVDMLCTLLHSQEPSCRLFSALNGEQAVATARDERPDLILLDIMMPDMDGLEVYRRIHRIDSQFQPAVFFLTARTDPEDVVAGIRLGADDYIEKPFDPALLLEKIRGRLQKIQQVRRTVFLDPLTGLFNQTYLMEKLAELCRNARRFGKPFSVLFADLDGFKAVNDRHGHLTGDAYLQHAASWLKRFFREVDTVARYAGDEFCILLPETSDPDAQQAMARLQSALAGAAFIRDGLTLPLQMSVGASTYSNATDTPQTLIQTADQAMYRQKSARGKTAR